MAPTIKIFLSFLFVTLCLSRSFWPNHGKDIKNTRNDPFNDFITSETAASIINKWNFTARGDISQTPSVKDNIIYFCDFYGYLYAVNAATGSLKWEANIANATGYAGDACRVTALSDKYVFTGSTLKGIFLKFDINNGQLLGSRLLDDHFWAFITQSPTVYGDSVYVGVSSNEEDRGSLETCCTFRGSFYRIRMDSFEPVWRMFTFPDKYYNGQWFGNATRGVSGVAVWGSSPVIDEKRNNVIIATGNPYVLPVEWSECQEANPNSTNCIPEDVLSDAVIAIDIDTGNVTWSNRLSHYDAWTDGCYWNKYPEWANLPCPPLHGDDIDFAMCPSMTKDSTGRDVLMIGQKSGFVWKLNADNGQLLGAVNTGINGYLGGVMWGGATDGYNYYVANANFGKRPVPLVEPERHITNHGFWTKIDVNTFNVSCQVDIPFDDKSLNRSSVWAYGPPTLVNDVVIVTSTNAIGNQVHIFDKNTCRIIKSFATGAEVAGGVSINGACFYVGNGYKRFDIFAPTFKGGDKKLYAFCVDTPVKASTTTINIFNNNRVCN